MPADYWRRATCVSVFAATSSSDYAKALKATRLYNLTTVLQSVSSSVSPSVSA